MNTPDPGENTSPLEAKTITIKDVELRTSKQRRIWLARRYYVRFVVGGNPKATNVAQEKKNITSWTQKLFFDVNDRCIFVVEVYRKHRTGKHILVARLTDTIGGVSGQLRDSGIFERDISEGSGLSGITIKFTVLVPEAPKGVNADLLQATDAVAQMTEAVNALSPAPPVVDHMSLAIGTAADAVIEEEAFESTWGVLLQKMSLFNEIVSRVAEVHPYASLAWTVISAANQILVSQKNRDLQIIRLAGILSDVFTFVNDADPLRAIKAHLKAITLLIQQVTECGYFIADYAKDEKFLSRMAKHTLSNVDATITCYENKLKELKTAFLDGVTLQTELVVIGIAESIDLNDMPYAFGAKYTPAKGCLEGTRKSVIQGICDVLDHLAQDSPRVCLLTGVAGSGKSAIAHTISRLYDEKGRLGSSYFFASAETARRNPQNLFSTIARDLSDRDPHFKSVLCGIVKSNRALRTSASPSEQLQELIIMPSKGFHAIVPLVVVIDGLDESGNAHDRRELLHTLSKHITRDDFPIHLRFLITARPEDDILEALSNNTHIVRTHLRDTGEAIVNEDIKKFIYQTLCQYTELELEGPWGRWCQLLVERSQGLFQWASTACHFIQGFDATGLDRCERFRIVVGSSNDESFYPLDRLYQTILEQRFKLETAKRRFNDVMALILTLKAPLPLASFYALFGKDIKFREIIKPLGPLLDSGRDEETPIVLLHTSFQDFLLDADRSSAFHVHIHPNHPLSHGRQLLACMRNMLKFNMCNLKDSRLFNVAVPNLAHQANSAIPSHLAYACWYWMDHLRDAECTPELLDEVTIFKKFFPYWLEAISLLSFSFPESIQHALQTCTHLCAWAEGQEVAALASEAIQFIQVFDPILRKSTPHLYLSAMPQTPTSSPLCKLWSNHLQKHVSVTYGHPTNWPTRNPTPDISFITSIAYSPDGKHIVSGSSDKTVRIWNTTSGQCVAGPFQGHMHPVYTVAYSPNGKHVVSGSADTTIRIWDAITGQLVTYPLQGHTGGVNSVAYSPDGQHVVSGSWDNSIRIWNASNGQLLIGPLQGHRDGVNSVAYSPDGKHVVSGSWDNCIQIWNATNGQCMAYPLQGHAISIRSIVYSPDGRHIAFGSANGTIGIWNTASGQCMLLSGHQSTVCSIAYSSDGNHMVSSSLDNSIRIWNTTSGQCIAGPFWGHTGYVFSVAYSPDGCYLASGSDDYFIKVWKVQELISLGSIYNQNGWLLSSDDTRCFGWIAPWFRSAFYLPVHSLLMSPNNPNNTYQHDVDHSLFGNDWRSCWK